MHIAECELRVSACIRSSIEAKRRLLEDAELMSIIGNVCELLVDTLRRGNKVLLFGNGGSAADAQHIAAEFVGRFAADRPALHALALSVNSSCITAIGNDYGFDFVFSRQLEAVARPGDVAVGISTSGNSRNVLYAVAAAKKIGLHTIALTGYTGGLLRTEVDYCIRVPSRETPRIQECHILIGHTIAEIVEHTMFMNRAVFLDRDGVINQKTLQGRYITRWEDIHLLPGVIEAIKMLNRSGLRVIVVTNQRCVAKGLMTRSELERLHEQLCNALAAAGARIDDVYYCPHDNAPPCGCRKPAPGMLLEAARAHAVDITRSWMIGDSDRDIQAGRNAGCKTARVLGVEPVKVTADLVGHSLLDAVCQIVHPKEIAPARPLEKPAIA